MATDFWSSADISGSSFCGVRPPVRLSVSGPLAAGVESPSHWRHCVRVAVDTVLLAGRRRRRLHARLSF